MKKIHNMPKGYVVVCVDGHGRYLCVPKKMAEKRNWMTKRAVIVDDNTKTVSRKMLFQAAFKWITWELLPEFEEEKE